MKQAIVAVAICCVAFASLSYGRDTEPAQRGEFTLAVSADGSTAWRLNTETGAVSYCRTAQNGVLTKNSDGSYTYTPKPADQKNPDKATCVPWVN
jgi:hypothetical protein